MRFSFIRASQVVGNKKNIWVGTNWNTNQYFLIAINRTTEEIIRQVLHLGTSQNRWLLQKAAKPQSFSKESIFSASSRKEPNINHWCFPLEPAHMTCLWQRTQITLPVLATRAGLLEGRLQNRSSSPSSLSWLQKRRTNCCFYIDTTKTALRIQLKTVAWKLPRQNRFKTNIWTSIFDTASSRLALMGS